MAFFSALTRHIHAWFGHKTGSALDHAAAHPVRPSSNQSTTLSRPSNNRRRKSNADGRIKATAAPQQNPAPKRKTAAPEATKRRGPAQKPDALKEVATVEGKMRFLDLAIHEDIQFGLQDIGFEYCTPIQEQALPIVLSGRDIAGKAQTGTGKTAAFLLAIFTRLLNEPKSERTPGSCRALVLAPTRELAIQIHKDAEAISRFTGLHNVVVFGGMDHEKQRAELAHPVDILIGTPGRVIDYSRSRSLDLGKAEFLVLDEADRMLDMGFIPDVKRIIAQLPKREQRQTMLFSATLDDSIMRLATSFQNSPEKVESEPDHLVGSSIEQTFYTVAIKEKLPMLLYFIRTEAFDRMLIFGNRKDHNLQLQDKLARYGVSAELLSGDIPQQKRLSILERFRSGQTKIVIATDVAARGIHVDDVSIVVNYDLPEHPEDYVHRIGRTGRAGHTGKSISFVCEYGAYSMPAIEEMLETSFKCIWPEDEMLSLPPPSPDYRPLPRERAATGGGGRRNFNRSSGRPRSR